MLSWEITLVSFSKISHGERRTAWRVADRETVSMGLGTRARPAASQVLWGWRGGKREARLPCRTDRPANWRRGGGENDTLAWKSVRVRSCRLAVAKGRTALKYRFRIQLRAHGVWGQKVIHHGAAPQVALATWIWGRDGDWQDATYRWHLRQQ